MGCHSALCGCLLALGTQSTARHLWGDHGPYPPRTIKDANMSGAYSRSRSLATATCVLSIKHLQRAARSGSTSLLGVWHSPLWESSFPQTCKHLTDFCTHLKMLFPNRLISSHNKPFMLSFRRYPSSASHIADSKVVRFADGWQRRNRNFHLGTGGQALGGLGAAISGCV